MRAIGFVTTALGVAVIVVGIVLGKQAVPDVQRYLRMRAM
jgi:hypothetical protein